MMDATVGASAQGAGTDDSAHVMRMAQMLDGLVTQWEAVAEEMLNTNVEASHRLKPTLPHELNACWVFWNTRRKFCDPLQRALIRLTWSPPYPEVIGDPGGWCYAVLVDGHKRIGGTSRGPDKGKAIYHAEMAAFRTGIPRWVIEE
jgi:hypothetical protein